MSFDLIQQALQQEVLSGATDSTRSARARFGVLSMRERPGFYIIRTRLPAGLLTADQLTAIASITEEIAWPLGVHLTTRQGIEIPGVPAAKVIPVLEKLAAVGVTTFLSGGNAVRAVVCCPFSGMTKNSLFDVTPYALAVDRHFRENDRFHKMPRKIKIAFESCTEDHVRTLATDIGLRAAKVNRREGFHIVVGGGLGAAPKIAQVLAEFIPAENLLSTLEAILQVFDTHGNRTNRSRARLKWLLEERGIEWFREEVARARKEIFSQGNRGLALLSGAEPSPATSDSRFPEAALGEAYTAWKETNVQPQTNPGRVVVSVRCPNGDLSPLQLRQLAIIARRFCGGLRTSIDQNLVLRHVAESALPVLYSALREVGLSACCAGDLIDITRCGGADVCLSAITSSRGAAQSIAEAVDGAIARDPVLRRLRIRVSGCPNSCSHHHAADIGLFGISKQFHGRAVPHYAILLGGSASGGASGTRVAEIPAVRIGQAIKTTLLYFREQRGNNETLTAFVQRIGTVALREKLAPLAAVPAPEESPETYRDLGADRDFRIGTKRGECAA